MSLATYKAIKKQGKKTRKAIKALTKALKARDRDDKIAADLNTAAGALRNAVAGGAPPAG